MSGEKMKNKTEGKTCFVAPRIYKEHSKTVFGVEGDFHLFFLGCLAFL